LIIGLSQRQLHGDKDDHFLFGTHRTFTFIGILGYVLLISDLQNKMLFIAGFIVLSVLLSLFYYFKIYKYEKFGITTIMIALLTYSMSLVLLTQPLWLFLMVFVTILFFTELKETLSGFSTSFDKFEVVTLAKFIVIAGVILPVLPKEPLVSYLSISPYKIWLALVVISSISYLSYILRKYIFKKAGIILTGLLGGLYSSTATTLVLSRKSKENPENSNQYTAAILLAITMMYLRILVLSLIFNEALFRVLLFPIVSMAIITISTALTIFWLNRKHIAEEMEIEKQHPLEFKVALIFTIIYVAFTFINYFTIEHFGKSGLNLLSIIVGVTDIDPFLLNIFQGKYAVPLTLLAIASLQAIISNNVLKLIYACTFYKREHWKTLIIGFAIIIVSNILLIFTI
jgi:uncharacterized membrane protein (DUF4010 family)